MRRREPPTPYGRDPGRRGVRSPGTSGRCGPFGAVIRHPVPPPQSPTRRPPRQLPVSTVKARPCPVCAPLRPAPAHLSAIHRRAGHRRSRDAPANGCRAAKMAFRCDPSEPAAKGSRGRRCHGTPTDTDQMSEGSCHAGSVSDTAGGALTPCPAPEAGPAGSAGTVEGLGPKKRAPPSRSQKDRRMRRVPRGPIRGPGCQPGGKEAGPKRGPTRARADGRTLGREVRAGACESAARGGR